MKTMPFLAGVRTVLLGSAFAAFALYADDATDEANRTVVINVPKAPAVSSTEVPKPPKIVVNGGSDTKLRSIHFSKRYPPGYRPLEERIAKRFAPQTTDTKHNKVGEVTSGRIAAFLRADGTFEPQEVRETLQKAGFKILATLPLTKKRNHTLVVFTDDALSRFAAEHGAEFLADLHLDIDKEQHRISITNPLYLAKAYMGEKFDASVPKQTLQKLKKTFANLHDSKDMLKFEALPHYKFMNGMPEYGDMVEIALGDDWNEAKLKDNKHIVYTHKLPNGAIVAGITFRRRTQKFPYRIGTKNAALLPYPVLIKDKKVKMMDPKYYIALMYPQLQMSQFMTIANVPDAIVKEAQHIFR